jgi:tetratricopeptide (TPR) repeat protein
VHYTGRVHEQPTPRDRLEPVALAVGHDGYRAEAMARKEERNTALLVAALNDEPDNAYLWYQLGSEFVVRGRHEEALPHLVQAFNLTHPETGPPPTPHTWWHRLTIRLMRTLTRLGRHDEAMAVGEMESARWAASSDFHFVCGQTMREYAASLDVSQDELAGRLVLTSLDLWARAVELGDRPEYTGVLSSRATVLAAEALAEDYATMGRDAEAEQYRALANA